MSAAPGGEARHLVQVLLPLYDNTGVELPRTLLAEVRDELTARFGGLTAYARAPVRGYWQPDGEGGVQRDDLVILEVMAPELDADWWRGYRAELERRFRQERIVVRAEAIRLL